MPGEKFRSNSETESLDINSIVKPASVGLGTRVGTDENIVGTALGDGVTTGEGTALDDGVMIGEGMRLDDGVIIVEGTVLDDGVMIGEGTALDDGVMMGEGTALEEGVMIGEGTALGVMTGDGTALDDGVITGEGTTIGDGDIAGREVGAAEVDGRYAQGGCDGTGTVAAVETDVGTVAAVGTDAGLGNTVDGNGTGERDDSTGDGIETVGVGADVTSGCMAVVGKPTGAGTGSREGNGIIGVGTG